LRRALRRHLPALAHWFHLKPSDLDDMHPGEIRVYLDELDAFGRAQRKRG
jgi:hypothetical protein